MTKTQTILQGQGEVLLKGLGITASSEPQQQKIIDALIEHLHQLVVETVIVNLPEDRVDEFEAALEKPDELYDTVMKLTAQIPNIDEKIEKAIENELEIIAAAKHQLDAK